MNHVDDLVALLDDRAGLADDVHPDLGDVRARARHKRRTHRALTATAALTAVGLGAGGILTTRSSDREVVTDRGAGAPGTGDRTTERRTLPSGVDVIAELGPARPVYGPFGDDHLWRTPASCPAVLRFWANGTDRSTVPTYPERLPVRFVDASGRSRGTEYLLRTPTDDGTFHSSLVAVISDARPGNRYRFERGATVDEVVADSGLVMLEIDLGDADSIAVTTEADRLQESGPDGSVLDSFVAEVPTGGGAPTPTTLPDAPPVSGPEVPASDVPEGCGAPLLVTADSDGSPADVAAADAAARAAVTALTDTPGTPARMRLTVQDVAWASATSGWVRYLVADASMVPDAPMGTPVTGALLWAQVELDHGAWAVTPEAGCAFRHQLSLADCTELPATAPLSPFGDFE